MLTQKKKYKIIPLIILATVIFASFVGYNLFFKSAKADEEGNGAQSQAGNVMPVQVQIVEAVDTQLWREFSARLEATQFAEIRPQISGRIINIRFKDGANVSKGDILYVIDPRPYEAALNEAKAELKLAKTEADLSEKDLRRAKGLIDSNAISQRILDERKSRVQSAKAAIDQATAKIETARINLDYAYLKAPISGRAGRAEIKVGNLVEANINAPTLTTIISTKKIYADFEVDEQTYLTFVRAMVNDDKKLDIPVKLFLSDGEEAVAKGVIDSFDNRIDVTNGTIRARALFENDKDLLVPGMFAKVKVGSPNNSKLITISEKAIGTDQDRKFVYTVNSENIVKYREVEIGESQNGRRIIKNGLEEGDKVITQGIIRLRPDMLVEPNIQLNEVISTDS